MSVNGKSAKAVQLYALREELKGEVVSKFKLRLKSQERVRTVTLVLADQV